VLSYLLLCFLPHRVHSPSSSKSLQSTRERERERERRENLLEWAAGRLEMVPGGEFPSWLCAIKKFWLYFFLSKLWRYTIPAFAGFCPVAIH
jgi:hypothetical protein